MHLNFDKTTNMILGTRYKLQDAQYLKLIIENYDLKHVSQQKYWDNLSFASHIDKLYSAISSKISLLRKVSTYVVSKRYFIRHIYNH